MHGPGFVRIHCDSPSFVYFPLFSGYYFKLELDSSSLLFWLPAIFFSAPALCISVLFPVRWNRLWYRIARAPAQRSALAPQIETQGFLSNYEEPGPLAHLDWDFSFPYVHVQLIFFFPSQALDKTLSKTKTLIGTNVHPFRLYPEVVFCPPS